MNLKKFKETAHLIRKSSRYSIYDLPMKKLTTSLTILHPGKETRGHSHKEEEVYVVLKGKGVIQLDDEKSKVAARDIILIEKNVFHKVFNPTGEDLTFFCIFEKYRGRGK
jgi:mannose-6-phosphate isomerase-like protein (cupin superfamily)